MKISTKGRYGMRLMVELACSFPSKKPVLLREIAEKQGISVKYLEQIVMLLKNAKLIRSIRGAKGGYLLIKAPSEIRLSEVLEALEGNIDITECVGYPDLCDKSDNCVTREIWETISSKIREFLYSLTLEDICKENPRGEK